MRRLALIACASITCLMSQARATALDSQGIATDLSFIETQGDEDFDFAGFPCVRISGLGRRQRKVDDDDSFERRPGMDNRAFPWPTLALVSGDRVAAVAEGGAGLDRSAGLASRGRPTDPTDIGFIIGTSFGNGYRLTGDPSYKNVLLTTGNTLASPSLYNPNVGAVRSWTFPRYHFPVIIDSMQKSPKGAANVRLRASASSAR